jgi:hypothetical protein
VPVGSAAPFQIETYPAAWQDSALVSYLTQVSGGALASTAQSSGGKPQGTLLSRDWTGARDGLKYSASIDTNTAGRVVIIQCSAYGTHITNGSNFLQTCLGDSVASGQADAAKRWVATQVQALANDLADSPTKTFTSPQPAFGATRATIRSTMNLAEKPAVPDLLLYMTSANPS